MARILGLSKVALSLPLLLLGACTSVPPSSSANSLNNSPSNPLNRLPNRSQKASPHPSANSSANLPVYQPPLRDLPLRTESAGVRLNEEYCIDSPSTVMAPMRLTQSFPRLILSVKTLLPMPVVPSKSHPLDRNLSCNG